MAEGRSHDIASVRGRPMLSKSQARAFFLIGTGVFSAIFIGLTMDSMRQVPARTHEKNMSAQVVRGKWLWDKNNCMGCHTLYGEGAYYAPELTQVYARRGKEWMKVFLKNPEAMFPGERKMVNYHFGDSDIEDLIAFFEWAGHVDLNGFPAKPRYAAMASASSQGKLNGAVAGVAAGSASLQAPSVFQAICIACHALNGVGGNVGPALDSVFARKSRNELVSWLRDPAAIKPGTKMPKLPLSETQIDSLADFLTALGGVR